MDSILNNSAALSALQALQMTQQSLATVQNQVSTGLSVASAADNSAYWSIAAQLNADSGIVTASNDALSEGQSVLATATSAINSVITTLNSMATALTQAQNPGAETGDINTSLASLGRELTDAVNGASFNGLNVLNGTQNTLSFVAGYNASSTGGSVNAISFAAQALTGAAAATTTTLSTITDPTTIANLAALYTTPPTNATLSYGNDVITASTTGPAALTVESEDLYGNVTTTTYTALDANGNNSATDTSLTFATASSLAVS
jgi:flagellin